jgi:hypothetical protein
MRAYCMRNNGGDASCTMRRGVLKVCGSLINNVTYRVACSNLFEHESLGDGRTWPSKLDHGTL